MAQTRQQRIWWSMAGAFAAAIVAGLACGALMRFSHRWPEALLFAVMSLVVLLAIAAATPLWRRLDDMAREAHATAWYWGGLAGLGIGLVWLIALYGVRSQMFQGAALVVLLEVAGYGLCWLGWWAMRRSREA